MIDIYKWIYGERGRDAASDPTENLARLLEPHNDSIRATEKPIIVANPGLALPAEPMGSRLGGLPWWPAGAAYPADQDGEPLFLLLQINFSEAPALPPFPQRGLLQFFIGGDDMNGCNFDRLLSPTGFRAVYHEAPAGPALDPSGMLRAALPGASLPLAAPLDGIALSLEAGRMVIDPSDYRFAHTLSAIAEDDDLLDAYTELFAATPIRLGGYPTFTQQDPRDYGENIGVGDFSLLTVDTTDGIMWGDSGAAQFLMHESDLEERNFTRVAYNWDCY